jgi:hypothetical protein
MNIDWMMVRFARSWAFKPTVAVIFILGGLVMLGLMARVVLPDKFHVAAPSYTATVGGVMWTITTNTDGTVTLQTDQGRSVLKTNGMLELQNDRQLRVGK